VEIYFRTDITRLTFVELWRISSRPRVFLTGCVHKLLALRTPVRSAVGHDDEIHALQAEEVPDAVLGLLQPLVEEFQQIGARLAFYQMARAVGNLEGYSAVLLAMENNAVIVGAWSRAQVRGSRSERAGCLITSQLEDGNYFCSSNQPALFHVPPQFRVRRSRDATPTELARQHQHALAESDSAAIPIEDGEAARKVLLAVKCRIFEWNVSRGVWVPLTSEELDRLRISVSDNPSKTFE